MGVKVQHIIGAKFVARPRSPKKQKPGDHQAPGKAVANVGRVTL
jgi:hypothetical protein